MNEEFSAAVVLALALSSAVSMVLGAIAGFAVARLFPSKDRWIPEAPELPCEMQEERPAETPAIARRPIVDSANRSALALPRIPSVAPSAPSAPIATVRHIVEAEFSDSEIDALPAELPSMDRPRQRIAPPPRTRAMNRL